MPRIKPNMVDRLFLLLDGLQGAPSLNHFFLTLDGPLDRERLARALHAVLEEQPLLATRVRAGRIGKLRRHVGSSLAEARGLITSVADETVLAFAHRSLDLTRVPPLRLHLAPDAAGGGRLTAGIHHSVVDGGGGIFVLDRLAAHYAALCDGTTVDPPPTLPASRSYAAYFKRLSIGERLRALRGAGRTLGELTERAEACVAFCDTPLPARGRLAWRSLTIEAPQVTQLKGWARAHGGTLNDLLFAATAAAGYATWAAKTPQADLPIIAMIPVSLREGVPCDPANRVAEVPVRLNARDCADFSRAFAAVMAETPKARDRVNAFSRIFERALASRLPARTVRGLLTTHLDRPLNRSFTYVFSNMGVLDPLPCDFGPLKVLTAGALPPLTMPPGFAVVACTKHGCLTLTLGYLAPIVSEESVADFTQRLSACLSALSDPV